MNFWRAVARGGISRFQISRIVRPGAQKTLMKTALGIIMLSCVYIIFITLFNAKLSFIQKIVRKNYPFWLFLLKKLFAQKLSFPLAIKQAFPCSFVSRHLFTPEEGHPTSLSESNCVIFEIFFVSNIQL